MKNDISDIMYIDPLNHTATPFKPKQEDGLVKFVRADKQPPAVDVELSPCKLAERYTELMERYKGGIDYYPNNHAAMVCCMELALEEQDQLRTPLEPINGLEEAIHGAEHDYRVGNTVIPQNFYDIIEAAKKYHALTKGKSDE